MGTAAEVKSLCCSVGLAGEQTVVSFLERDPAERIWFGRKRGEFGVTGFLCL